MTFGVNAPNGLVPTRYLDGNPWNGQANPWTIASSAGVGYATAIGQWDPVTKLADGSIGIAVAGSKFLGVLRGIQYIDSNGQPQFKRNYPASLAIATGTIVQAFVVDDKDIVYSAQETDASGNAGTPLALADVNLNINFLIGTPNASTGASTSSINNATEANTATLNLTIIGLTNRPGNIVGNFANWDVVPNNSYHSDGTQGV